jgi:AbrB family looped-hinge helix DNA binding protein
MEITRLSSKGQVIIPKALRAAHHWEAGQELIAIDVGDGILLKPKKPFPETTLAQVAGCLKYRGNPKSLDELEDAIRLGVMEQWHDRSRPKLSWTFAYAPLHCR